MKHPIFFKILHSFNVLSKLCIHTLQQRLVAYSPSLSYCNQIFTSKGAIKGCKEFGIQFSSAVLYFTNFGAEEVVFFVFLLFFALLEVKEQPKKELRKICLFFPGFSNISNPSSLLHFKFLYTVIFSVQLIYTKLT